MERKNKRLMQQVKDYKDIISQFKKQDRNTKEFIYHYLKPRHRPRFDEEGNELWSQDGRNYTTLESGSLRPTNRIESIGLDKLSVSRLRKLKALSEKLTGGLFQ